MISLSDLRAELDLPGEREAELPALLAELVDQWERETGRLWQRRAGWVQTLRPSVPDARTVWLELWPVEALTLVEERLLCGPSTDWTALQTTDYTLSGTHELLRLGGGGWLEEVRVTYTGGYVAAPTPGQALTPPDVRRALLLQARYAQQRWSGDRAHVSRVSANGGATDYLSGDCHPVFEAAAARHRRHA